MKIVLIALIACFAQAAARADNLEPLFPAPAFKLTDQDGRTVTNADLAGTTWVVDFIFTRCGGVCPLMTQKLVKVAQSVAAPNVRFVSISVDPDYDTPAVLKQYAADRGATDPRFLFLTGRADAIYDLAQKGFKVTALPARGTDPILHDERFLLVGPDGQIRGVYPSNKGESMARLVADANALAAPPASPWIKRFPAINASLNATSGILLCLAMVMIQGKRVRAHAYLMIAAVVSSTAFLACYLTYHYLKHQAGAALTRYPDVAGQTFYQGMLLSHTILAVVVLPMIFMTLFRAYKRQWDKHRRIARPTFWVWLYVSATGVLVYWMLYHLAPRLAAQAGLA
jgi:protein SCO1/2/putative membrane protein